MEIHGIINKDLEH